MLPFTNLDTTHRAFQRLNSIFYTFFYICIYFSFVTFSGILAVSRAFGDRTLKRYVTAEPEILSRRLEPGDDFLILASDGMLHPLKCALLTDLT